MVTISSSRTLFIKIATLFFGVSMIYLLIVSVSSIENDNDFIRLGFMSFLALVLVYLVSRLKFVKHYQGEFELTGNFGDKVSFTIDEVDVLNCSQFRISLIDPLGMSRFTQLKVKKEGKVETYLILNPSKLSTNWDILKLLQEVKKKRGTNSASFTNT